MRSSSRTRMAPEQSPGTRHRKREQTLSRSIQAAAAVDDRTSSRRRSMGLFKQSSNPPPSREMHRTREHAKQIAMALSHDLSAASSFADFGSAFGGFSAGGDQASCTESTTTQSHDDFFASAGDPFALPLEPVPKQRPQTVSQHRNGPPRRTVQDVFSDSGEAVDWPAVVRVSALTASPVTRKAPSTASSSRSGGTTSTRPTKTPERRPTTQASTLSPAPVNGAAARRLMRQQVRKEDATTVSPYGMKRSDSSSSSKGSGSQPPNSFVSTSKPTDHVSHYTHHAAKQAPQYHRSPIAPSHRPVLRSESSSGSSAVPEVNLFDSTNKTGFSFDAFGLDGAEVQREVNEAMNDLAGSHPHISLFFQDPKDDFAFGRWDDVHSNSSNHGADEPHGFVDGFRVHKQPLPMQHVRESPTRSERSSLTSESLEPAANGQMSSVNMFKQQAGFHASNKPRKVVRPASSDMRPSDVVKKSAMYTSGKEATLPQIPKLDAHIAKKSLSPRSRSYGGDNVEFFGEESSSEDEIPKSPLHTQSMGEMDMDGGPASDVGVNSDLDLPSDVGVSSGAGAALSDIGHLPFIDFKEKGHARRNSPSVRTESTAATTAVEEKKEEESPVKTVGKLRSQWEAKDQFLKREAEQKLKQRQHVPSAIPKEHITRLQTQLGDELLTPEILTAKHSEIFAEAKPVRLDDRSPKHRSVECLDQRTSLSSVKERLKSPVTRTPDEFARRLSKSDGGAAVRHSSVSAILSNLQRNGLADDSRSETNESPTAYSVNVQQLSRGPSGQPWSPTQEPRSPVNCKSVKTPESGFESQAMKLMRQQNPSMPIQTTPTHSDKSQAAIFQQPAQKQLTYRERRELELRLQREEENKNRSQDPNGAPKERDVASMIKQRIAANKKNLDILRPDGTSGQQLDISSLRNRLRPAPIEINNVSAPDDHGVHLNEPSRSNSAQFHSEDRFQNEVDLLNCAARPFSETIDEVTNSSDFTSQSQSRYNISPHMHLSPREQRSSLPAVDEDFGRSVIRSPQSRNSAHAHVQLSPREFQSELVVSPPHEKSPVTKPVVASAAVSHMLMLQQLQQRQTNVAPLKAVALLEKPVPSKPLPPPAIQTEHETAMDEQKIKTPKATMMMLNAFLAGRESLTASDRHVALQVAASRSDDESLERNPVGFAASSSNALPALKDDPKFSRYFKMLSLGMPMEVVKHAMTRDGLDPSIMDCDHNKPFGIPLKDDPEYSKYFRMLKIGLPMEAVKHAMERDGLDSAVMDQDHDLPVSKGVQTGNDVPKEQDSHRRARLHWKTLRKVTSNSLWAQIGQDDELNIEIDEEEFQELFQAEKAEVGTTVGVAAVNQKRSAVCVIDTKRANNGGIILARLKMTHDDLADAVDRIDEQNLTAEQIENIIEYLPTKEERKALEAYMLEGGQDAAEKFDVLCECEKFMVSMMTVKHAKRKVSALLFKLQFESCIRDIQKEAFAVEQACEELSHSVRLRQLLGIVLTFGNRLNTAGNGKGKAGAFTLDSLLKLNQAKAFDKKTTFLHYIILIVQRNNEILLNFKDDLPTVFASEKIFWDQCVSDLEEVENQLENVRKMALYQAHQSHAYRIRRKSKREDPEESLSEADETLTLEEEVEALRSTPIGLFTLSAIKYVSALRDKVENTKLMFARLLEYFGEEERQMQPHELFSIIVSFSRDFDKAKEQVLANEKFKQREERKRQVNSGNDKTPGKPPSNASTISDKKSVDTMKSSNLQPNMTPIFNELKLNGKRITDASATSPDVSHGRRQIMERDTMRDQHSMMSPQPPQSSPKYRDNTSAQRLEFSETSFMSDSPQDKDVLYSKKSPSNFMSRSNVGQASPTAQITEDPSNEFQDDESQVTTETLNSSVSASSLAQRAKERMRRHRAERLPSIPATPPTPMIYSSKKVPKATDMAERESPTTPRQDEPQNASISQVISPRSSVRMKRRAEQRMKARRSNNASIQL